MLGLRSLGRPLRLTGPTANDPTGRILYYLLLGLLAWTTFVVVVAVPLFIVRKADAMLLAAFLSLALIASLVLLRRGLVRQGSLVYPFWNRAGQCGGARSQRRSS